MGLLLLIQSDAAAPYTPARVRKTVARPARQFVVSPEEPPQMLVLDERDPSDIDSVGFDWSKILNQGESIASSSWTVSGPDALLTLGTGQYAASFASQATTAWPTNGTDGKRYTLTNRITTNSTPPRSFLVPVKSL